MKAILLQTKNMDQSVIDTILDKQAALRKEKRRVVSLEQTINVLIKEAYVKEGGKK